MLDIKKYQKTEAIEELLDDYDLIMASLDADIVLKNIRIQFAESKMKKLKLANERLGGFLRIKNFKEAIYFNELKTLTYQHYRDGLCERLNNIMRGEE